MRLHAFIRMVSSISNDISNKINVYEYVHGLGSIVVSIGSAVFAQHTRVTNTQTDTQTTLRATYVATGGIYISACDAA